VRVAFTVPANLEGEFRRMAEQWLEKKIIDKNYGVRAARARLEFARQGRGRCVFAAR